jgi:hypothetical protein
LDFDDFLTCAKEWTEMGLNIAGFHGKWRKGLEIIAEQFAISGFVEFILFIRLGLLARSV